MSGGSGGDDGSIRDGSRSRLQSEQEYFTEIALHESQRWIEVCVLWFKYWLMENHQGVGCKVDFFIYII